MHIGEIFNDIYDNLVGWRPASGSVKPVHVANGLLRSVSGRKYNIEAVGRFLISHKQGGVQDPLRKYESLTSDPLLRDHFGSLATDYTSFERTRRYAKGLLAADKAVFPSAAASSLTLTTGLMVSGDYNDRGLGRYGSALLMAGGGELASLLRNSLELERPLDPISVLAWPLLVDRTGHAGGDTSDVAFMRQSHNKAFLNNMGDAADSLASHTINSRDPLRLIQRAVHFVCVATVAHAQALAVGGKMEQRPPLLLVSGATKGSELAVASERSLLAAFSGFDTWLADQLERRLSRGKPLVRDEVIDISKVEDGRSVRALLRTIASAKKGHPAPTDAEVNERFQVFATARNQYRGQNAVRVFAQALQEIYSQEYESGGPQSFLLSLGRRCGLLYPHFQGRSRDKRVMPNARILEMLVRACVRHGETVSLEAFLGRLWDRFGCVVGGRHTDKWSDADVLAAHGAGVEIEDLATNTECFVDELVSMGFARRYPDGVTFVGESYGN